MDTNNLIKEVKKRSADFGISFDGDGDRIICCDEKGQVVDGDKILALLTKELLSSNKLNKKTVVSTIMSNLGFENYLTKKLGVKRLDAWHDFKQFAQKSRGENQIDLPGYGLIYLKIDKDITKGNLRYKDTAFENPNDGYLITKKAFDSAWDKA